MLQRVKALIVPDKFKGTLTASEAAQAIASGWRRARPGDQLDLLPMSDGGDGFGEIMSALVGAEPIVTETVDAAHRPISASWWWHAETATAIIESARIIGLAQLPRGKYHPFDLDTRGLGIVLRAAEKRGADKCIIGIGGSATNDAGFGFALELGWEFHDDSCGKLTRWTELEHLARLGTTVPASPFAQVTVAVDVQNPLLGPEGCTRVYGPQKGLRPDDFPRAERCLDRLAVTLKEQHGLDFANAPGAGAAGGLGFGLCAFAGAQLAPGFDLFAEQARLSGRLHDADLVITAEGAIDSQTLMGKGVGQIAGLCREARLPCVALAGMVADRKAASKQFSHIHALTDLTSPEQAMTDAAAWLEKLAARAAEQFDLQRAN
jgi:glycerate kinase